jgi:hypothetical protein
VAQAGAAQAEVEVELWVLPAGAGTEVGGKPTTTADAGEAGRWGHDGTPYGTLGGTIGWSCHKLSLLGLLVGVARIIRNDDVANKFWE